MVSDGSRWAGHGRLAPVLLLRAFLAVVYLVGGISKIADRRFLDASSVLSMHASVVAARQFSPIGGLLGPVQSHSTGFGLLMAAAELAVGLGLALGLFTRVAAAGGMVLSLLLWLTVSWQATPWFTSADLVYLFALTPLLIGGAAGTPSVDGWLATTRRTHPGTGEDRRRRALLGGGAAAFGLVLLGGSALFRRRSLPPRTDPLPEAQTLARVSDVPVGGALKVTDRGEPIWLVQVAAGRFTAFDARCPHEGCQVDFVSAATGFLCPCHQSRFTSAGARVSGPTPRGLTPIAVHETGGQVQTG